MKMRLLIWLCEFINESSSFVHCANTHKTFSIILIQFVKPFTFTRTLSHTWHKAHRTWIGGQTVWNSFYFIDQIESNLSKLKSQLSLAHSSFFSILYLYPYPCLSVCLSFLSFRFVSSLLSNIVIVHTRNKSEIVRRANQWMKRA